MRRAIIAFAVSVMIAGLAPAARAGGGGCHDDVSSEEARATVDMKGLCFWPTIVHVSPGQTVTWRNYDDAVLHTVTGMPGTFDSDDIAWRQTFRHTFTEAGTYAYYCVLHRRMAGAVVVGSGSIAKAAVPAGPDSTSLTGSKTQAPSSSAAGPIAALAVAIPAAGAIGFRTGRRRVET